MPKRQDIDRILRDWPYEPGEVMARRVKASDGREVLQMRVEMGVLQLEVADRPDGARPGGQQTYFDFLLAEALDEGESFELTEEQCEEADREFVQFYHRRICWLAMREFRLAAKDAEHSLNFMDFVRAHSPDEQWTLSHEQYRPFVLFHRVQSGALAELEEKGPEAAILEISDGLRRFQDMFLDYDAEDRYDEDELVHRLVELRESLRERFDVGKTLAEQLAEAIEAEEYEKAAQLRDQMNSRSAGKF